MEKITKKQMYTALINFAGSGELTTDDSMELSMDDVKAFAEHELELLAKRAEKAKETAAKKKAEDDTLMPFVEAALTDELQTVGDILVKVAEGAPEATAAKVIARLRKLVEAGKVKKEDVKVSVLEGKTAIRKAYSIND